MIGTTMRTDQAIQPRPHAPRFLPLLRQGFAANGIFLLLACGFALVFECLPLLAPGPQARTAPETALVVLLVLALFGAIMLVVIRCIGMAVYEKPDRPALRLLRHIRDMAGNPAFWAAGIPVYLSLSIFMFAFGLAKSNITVFQPYAWDVTFDRLDALLHFGWRPWEWLQPVFGRPVMTLLLNINYNIWFFVLTAFWVYYAFLVPPGVERTRFFLAFMLTWIIGGGVFAILFASAGPCYFGAGHLGLEPDPYAGLMSYLRAANESVPVSALSVQAMLWNALGETMPFGGVSAMPSMHNASALLFLLTSGRFPRWVRGPLLLHAVLIFIGSVHLAWHYAVDSYLAWAVTLAVWYPAGRIARWWEARPEAKAFEGATRRS